MVIRARMTECTRSGVPTMKLATLLFVLITALAAQAQTPTPCKMNMFIQTVQGVAPGATDATANLFLYGLRAAVHAHQGCIVNKVTDANLGLYVTTLKLPRSTPSMDQSVVAVALAVPIHGVPVYIDDYVFVIEDTDSIEGQVNTLLSSIGATLIRYTQDNP